MLENIGSMLVLVAFAALVIYRIRRRASLSPEQRRIEDLEHKQRRLAREVRDHKRYGS